ncbi:MAG TPA: GntR family transcriptional regulator [Symbiobacteriaceae bacterium]|nr:GntR family transcriptional regulator [Symbiobacteriaceae bacterium]
MPVTPAILHSDPLYVKVYSLLRDWIIEGRFHPGERMKETALAAELGVSRTPVRDALRRLEKDHLIVSVPGPAYEVYSPTEQDLADLFGARAVLEGGAAHAAAERHSGAAIHDMAIVLEQMREAYPRRRIKLLLELDTRFHDLMVAASGNTVLVELHNHLSTRLRHIRSLGGDIIERQVQVLEQHTAIIEALRSGSGIAAEEAVRVHIFSVYRASREAFLERSGPRLQGDKA